MNQYLVEIAITIDPESDRPRRRTISVEGNAADVGQEFGKLAMEFGKIVMDSRMIEDLQATVQMTRGVFDTEDSGPGSRA